MTSATQPPTHREPEQQDHHSRAISILACGGNLPLEIANILKREGRSVNVVCIAGMADADYSGFQLTTVSIGRIGALLRALKAGGIRDMLIAGHARRPDLRSLNIDTGFIRNFTTILGLMRGGDDHVLRKIARFFERNGLNVRSIAELAPELLTPSCDVAGPASKATANGTEQEATDALRATAAKGLRAIHALGPFDVGQAVILENGSIAAIEGAEGTNRLIARHAESCRLQAGAARRSRVLVKAAKPSQDLRVDLPTIGVETIERCAAAGVRTIALEAGRSLIVSRAETIASARKHDITLISLASPITSPNRDPGNPQTSRATRSVHTRAAVPFSMPNLARGPVTAKNLRDAVKGLRLLQLSPNEIDVQAAIISRENVMAINVSEPMQSFIERSEQLVQWGDRRQGGLRNRVLVLARPVPFSSETIAALAASKVAGVAILTTAGHHDALDDIIELANTRNYFVLSPPLSPT